MLVGNKVDLPDQRLVTTEMGQALADKFGCGFLETSAKTRYNLDQIFKTLVKGIFSQNGITGNKGTAKKAARTKTCSLL